MPVLNTDAMALAQLDRACAMKSDPRCLKDLLPAQGLGS
jgi:hypothetical protein